MKFSRLLTHSIAGVALAALVGLSSAAGTAQAGLVINGTFGYVPIGDIAYTPTNASISTATTVTIPSSEVVNTVPLTYLGQPNNLVGLVSPGDGVTVDPLVLPTISGPSFISNYMTFTIDDGSRFEYDMVSIIWTSSAVSNLSFNSQGTFRDTLGVYDPAAASLSGSFTQTGGDTGTVNASFTFASPPSPSAVPEPGSFVLMLGMFGGVGALGLWNRRRRLV